MTFNKRQKELVRKERQADKRRVRDERRLRRNLPDTPEAAPGAIDPETGEPLPEAPSSPEGNDPEANTPPDPTPDGQPSAQ